MEQREPPAGSDVAFGADGLPGVVPIGERATARIPDRHMVPHLLGAESERELARLAV